MENESNDKAFKKRLKCELSKADVAKRNDQLMQIWNQRDEAEADAAIAAARYKEEKAGYENRIARLTADMDTLRDQIKTSEEIREVDVREIPNHETKMIELHRLDVSPRSPKRIVSERPMDLIGLMESTPEATDEALALADAESEALKPEKKKGKKAKVIKSKAKRGNGKHDPSMEGVENLPPLVSLDMEYDDNDSAY